MKQLVRNNEAVSAARKAKEKESIERKRSETYIGSLKKSKSFQKYVVENIFQRNITECTDISRIIASHPNASKEEIGDLAMTATAVKLKLEKILAELS